MNLKKFSAIAISCIMAGAIFTGCKDLPASQDSTDVRIGMIAKLNASEESVNWHLKKLEQVARRSNINFSHNFHYYDSLNGLIMAINSDQIDEISTYRSVANLLTTVGPNLNILDHTSNMFDNFCCAVRKDDKTLRDLMNSAIESMKDDGTFDELIKTYITASLSLKEPTAVEMPKIDGEETIKVGVTGDLPPLDLILANGTPAGFNTAVLAEISKRIHKNIELVQIESNARASALTSGQIDVVFWVTMPGGFWNAIPDIAAPENIDVPDEIETTIPYFKDEIVHVGLKK